MESSVCFYKMLINRLTGQASWISYRIYKLWNCLKFSISIYCVLLLNLLGFVSHKVFIFIFDQGGHYIITYLFELTEIADPLPRRKSRFLVLRQIWTNIHMFLGKLHNIGGAQSWKVKSSDKINITCVHKPKIG